MITFSQQLVDIRTKRGLTQKALSEKLGVTEQAVSKWERGKSYPSFDLIQSMVYILEASPNQLFAYDASNKGSFDMNRPENMEKAEVGILPDPITLEFGADIIELFANKSYKGLEAVHQARVTISKAYGIVIPMVRVRDNTALGDKDYRILFGTHVVGIGQVYPHMKWGKTLEVLEGDIQATDPVYGHEIVWTGRELEGLIAPVDTMVTHLKYLVWTQYDKLISLKQVYDVVEILNRHNPLIKSLIVPHRVSYQMLKQVMVKLVVEKKKRINPMTYIIEYLDQGVAEGLDIDEMVEVLSHTLQAIEEADVE